MIALGVAVTVVWLYLLLLHPRARLQPAAPGPQTGEHWPSVIAVIPARNEAAVVAESIASLAAQNYPGNFRILVVDDHSDDGTAAIAQAAGTAVITAPPLPSGWTGKLWAVHQGVSAAQASEPDYLLLTDADIVHHPANLAELTARAAEGYDLVSYMVKLQCQSFAEHALIPAFVYFFFMLYPPAWIANPRRKTAGAAGGCILIRRQMLQQLGGIAAIRGQLIDDCALARAVKQSGGKVWLGITDKTRSNRGYATFAEIGRMVSRTAFTQLGYSAWFLAGTVFGLAFVYLLPVVLTMDMQPLGLAAWLLMSLAYLPTVRFYRISPIWALLLPLIAVFYMGCTLYSAWQYWRGKGGLWKGRMQAKL